MAKSSLVPQPQSYRFGAHQFVPADSTTAQDIIAASANDSTLKGLVLSSTESGTDHVVEIIWNDGTTAYLLFTVTVAHATAGVDGLTGAWLPLDRVSKKILLLPGSPTGGKIQARCQVAVGSGAVLTVAAFVEDY